VRRLLIDINVILDVLLDRAPHADAASRVWAAVETKQVIGLIPAHALTTIHYLVSREKGPREARRVVETLLGVFDVVPVGESLVREALALSFADFEDAVCAACAASSGCDLLVTRDLSGFRKSPVPVMTPAAAAAALASADPTPPLPNDRKHQDPRRKPLPE
jgi:predicted nucleic acid-binding protein